MLVDNSLVPQRQIVPYTSLTNFNPVIYTGLFICRRRSEVHLNKTESSTRETMLACIWRSSKKLKPFLHARRILLTYPSGLHFLEQKKLLSVTWTVVKWLTLLYKSRVQLENLAIERNYRPHFCISVCIWLPEMMKQNCCWFWSAHSQQTNKSNLWTHKEEEKKKKKQPAHDEDLAQYAF